MANSYTLFALCIDGLSEEQRDWLKAELVAGDEREMTDDEAVAFCEERGIDAEYEWPGFDHDFYDNAVYLFSEEGGNADNVAEVVCKFLKTHRPDEALGFEVAFTCEKPRPGEFGGAAYWCTAEGAEVFGTAGWLREMEEKHGQQT